MKTNDLSKIAHAYILNGKISIKPFGRTEVKKEAERQLTIKAKRLKKEMDASTVLSRFQKKYTKRANEIAKHLPDTGYSMGENKRVLVGKLLTGYYDNTQEYARSSKWKAQHGDSRICLSLSDFLNTEIIAGIITIKGEIIKNNLYKCEWIERRGSKQYGENIRVSGYIYKDFHFTAKSANEAKQIAAKKQIEIREIEKIKKLNIKAEKFPDNRTFVSVEDSYNGGNCRPGTLAFAQRNNIDLSTIGAVRADLLRKLENSSYVNKAIFAAKLRYVSKK